MSNRKAYQILENLGRAIHRLNAALQETYINSLSIDGTIFRFKVTIELYWKTLKRLLELEGLEARTPKESLKKAYVAGWIENEEAWLQMLHDRKETSHVYDEDTAYKIYKNIQKNFQELERTYNGLLKHFSYLNDSETS
ncbi:nucleotidyltransferase substrate binding protein [Pseudalkalibacillus decolorationis]|uniref:nucleotidyltransferase substrate binding protein n=1 Tax=Pseudalkalibacillus decolorationis TaxID=163879 RepID=UPI0021477B2F|nr:nucleotidyltransferase substrate binding protein [Pseudalkalibacillus decolorationis]